MVARTKLAKKQEEIQHLDTATQAIVQRIDKNNSRLLFSGFLTLIILLAVGIIGIYYQNKLATQNKQHIDCIIKLSETPLPSDSRSKFITDLNNTCKINFTK